MSIRRLSFFLALLLLASCQKDFNELDDTSQRWVEFSFNPSDYLSDILITTDQGFQLGASTDLDSDYKLRIVGYCFDADSALIDKSAVFGDMQHELSIRFKHLDMSQTYHFVFLADIVQFYSDLDYYEIWYHLLTHRLGSMYTMSQVRNDTPSYNVLLEAFKDVIPANQTLPIDLTPFTFNGYFVFTNAEGISASNINIGYNESFLIHNSTGRERTFHYYNFINDSSAVMSFTASYVDDSISIRKKQNNGYINVTKTLDIPNPNHRPFVATIDYSSLQLTNIDIY